MHVHQRQIMFLGCLVLVCIALFPPRRATEMTDLGRVQRPHRATSTRPLLRVFVFSKGLPLYWADGDRECARPAGQPSGYPRDVSSGPAIVDAGRLLVEALLVIALTAAWLAWAGYRSAAMAFHRDFSENDSAWVDGEALPVSRDGVAPDAAPVGRDGKPLYGTTAAPPDPGAET